MDAYAHHKYFRITAVAAAPHVAHVEINRPAKLNAFVEAMWLECRVVFDQLSQDPDVRAIVLTGAGDRAFTSGLDVHAAASNPMLSGPGGADAPDPPRRAAGIRRHITEFQDCITAIEACEKPVICVLHGISFGLAVDIACCADVRICARDVKIAVKEVDIGLAADIGTLSRLPKIVGSASWVKDVCLSARIFGAQEALAAGLVSQVHDTKAAAIEAALQLAGTIAAKSPVAVQGTKELLNHARDHSVAQSLRYTTVWNGLGLQTNDIQASLIGGMKKTRPTFEKL